MKKDNESNEKEVKNMKKLLILTFITSLAVLMMLFINPMDISAQTDKPQIKKFTDSDGDGIPNGLDPDFLRGTTQGRGLKVNFVDEDGDGICDYYQTNNQRGMNYSKNARNMNFVDADGDGICDNYNVNQGRGLRNGLGRNVNFIDEDGDGVCDRFPNGAEVRKNLEKGQYRGGKN